MKTRSHEANSCAVKSVITQVFEDRDKQECDTDDGTQLEKTKS
jgi:hypothetical protein